MHQQKVKDCLAFWSVFRISRSSPAVQDDLENKTHIGTFQMSLPNYGFVAGGLSLLFQLSLGQARGVLRGMKCCLWEG